MKATMLCATVVVLAICGCSAHAARDPASTAATTRVPAASTTMNANLNGTSWKFVEVAGTPVPPKVTATLSFKDGHASGKAGCNAYGARYTIEADGTAHFQRTLSTKMACLQPAGAMRVERGVFAALQHAVRVEREGAGLTLLDAAGKPLARLLRTASR
ncbi:MAG: META domain-containing protein [Rhodanobacteraceae bacterium]|nr:MAG: META domain-containing protein [Rhodanobacteraceae bacterium]